MDPTYTHLVISHMPIFGCLLGILVLVHGLFSKSNVTIEAAYLVFIASSIGGVTAYLTGEPTEEIVIHILRIAAGNITAHKDSADVTLIALAVLGSVCCMALILKNKLKQYHFELTILILCIAIIGFGLAARTAYLGGKIRHPEIGDGKRLLGAIDDYHEIR